MTLIQLKETMNRMSDGKYTGVKISYITGRIAWLWKWRRIDEKTMNDLVTQAMYIISLGVYD